jgi:hypothetical protein
MRDTNLTLVLKDNSTIDVIFPDRIGREYETPWLDRKGCREWNVDIDELLTEMDRKVVVGKWGTTYGTHEDTLVIPVAKVAKWKTLSLDKQKIADINMAEEDRHNRLRVREYGFIRGKEFDELVERVMKLESIIEGKSTK